MKQIICCALIFITTAFAQQPAPERPKITGIDHVDFYTTRKDANDYLYAKVLGLEAAPPLEPGQTRRFRVGTQWVGYSAAADPKADDRMDHIAFRTDNCDRMRKYLAAKGVGVPDSVSMVGGNRSFIIKDPEGHTIEFVQPSAARIAFHRTGQPLTALPDPVSRRMIHVGFIVRNRAAEDHFYKDTLEFHVYWYGWDKPGQLDWVAMQVPDGTDWLEYMLNVERNPDLKETGVMNHISLGVSNMHDAEAKLESHGWKPHDRDDHPEIGKDGKWQFDVFDPDFTRIELMEFTPVEKPCCSDFQGPHPSESK
jgi:catechol 2,3-dioxygenase-like lactoylglutathione lyase family enzyme